MKVLLVKLSSLGDVVHVMPVVQDIHRALSDTQIDWVVEKAFAPLVRRCEGVQWQLSHAVLSCFSQVALPAQFTNCYQRCSALRPLDGGYNAILFKKQLQTLRQ